MYVVLKRTVRSGVVKATPAYMSKPALQVCCSLTFLYLFNIPVEGNWLPATQGNL